ncbi:DNA repair photolyase [Caldicellulosiruptor bescii]|uniref:Radical SAM domain protein n=2 Tax=Caldicellulosiruptor bescii TaxID=31899 RepID=B9MP02_CALBD|nr:radical SAM protein [Caldicellulosiruptor bescii]ACM61561.1 Radical SAM domain protein [Caldicellulosiruptor bescii DSM 6725]PBC88626.1 DNA repair photolyase [Caldicellulosiruptor bescii]PBC91893.1 DNA repair photolyase [Caldicellulosiruptor bescii]PBD02696.1 DNA repair photolyase [Caldicellulosiruptor bescii]PBD07687.1 DNA repair photolyase [Caldicellulosiruptor bescii]
MEGVIRKQLLYRTGVEYGDYALNHVLGCAHGCKYPCYAFLMNRRFRNISYDDWIKPKLVDNTIELLEKELPKLRGKAKYINMCFATDPFMYNQPEVIKLSCDVIALINSFGIPVRTLTKGVYTLVVAKVSNHPENSFGVTLVSLSEEFRRKYEPNAAPVSERIKSLFAMHKCGIRTWVSIEPYPTPDIIAQDIDELLESVSFVDRIVFGRWNYGKLNYPDPDRFYREMAFKVLEFGKKEGIEVVIKKEVRISG